MVIIIQSCFLFILIEYIRYVISKNGDGFSSPTGIYIGFRNGPKAKNVKT